MTRTCGEALMQLLEAYGVTTVFGIPGEHTLELYRGIEKSGLHAITPRNEQGASLMADGYARVTGEPGVCTLITGPGVTNAATGIGQAYADSIPMLVISSANDSASLGKGWGRLHETTDLCAITRPLTAFSEMVLDPAELPGLVAQAYDVFRSQRPRPVHIAIPLDVMEKPVSEDWQPRTSARLPVPVPYEINAAADMLAAAARTVMVVGGGAQLASAEATRLAECLNVGVIASNAGKGIVSDANRLSLGGGIISPAVQRYLAEADLVLAIGTELAEADSFIYDLKINGKLIRVDIDPARFRDAFPADLAVLGDARAACAQLLVALDGRDIGTAARDTVAELDTVRKQQALDFSDAEKQHVRLLNALRNVLPNDAIVFGDITQLVYTGTAAMKTYLPRTWFYPAGFGTLGCALPGAIGSKLALPDRSAVALVGDGGFMFTVNELATAVEEKLTIPVIIWHNHSYAMIRDGMIKRGIPEIGVNPRAPDFIKLAEAFGCPGCSVANNAEFQHAMHDAMKHHGPSLIVVNEDDDWLTR
ncbi:MAG: 5-guanidino-2-oxopentanoate decarboxylase [Gammaproteobacteria bacterium]|nr:5-guanidino-2-oxopentanoate decarboxylase [Gammaproteobacteria bacterium]MDH3449450.1 5-guanidino-2-oxopentanoate decarboxylase [Gammaproteobacteria bacterium]